MASKSIYQVFDVYGNFKSKSHLSPVLCCGLTVFWISSSTGETPHWLHFLGSTTPPLPVLLHIPWLLVEQDAQAGGRPCLLHSRISFVSSAVPVPTAQGMSYPELPMSFPALPLQGHHWGGSAWFCSPRLAHLNLIYYFP